MKEVKTPRKPLAIYYALVLLMLLLLNFVLLPWMGERQIKEVEDRKSTRLNSSH